MSILASFDLLSRLTFPLFTERLNISHRSTLMIGVIALGVVRSTLAELTSYGNLMICCAVFGYLRAIFVVNQMLTISEFCTRWFPEKVAGAIGINMVFKGLAVLSIGQLLAWSRDYFESYNWSLHCQNILLSIVMIVWMVEMAYRRSCECR